MEARIAKQNRLAELEHMKTLFKDFLPVGDDRSQIDKTFFELEELICTKGPESVQDDFDYQSVVEPGSGSTEHHGNDELPREYTYYAPHLSKLQAQHFRRQRESDPTSGDPECRNASQDLEASPHAQGHVLPVQDESASIGYLPYVPEHSNGCDDCEQEPLLDSDDSQGELYSRVFGRQDQDAHAFS